MAADNGAVNNNNFACLFVYEYINVTKYKIHCVYTPF